MTDMIQGSVTVKIPDSIEIPEKAGKRQSTIDWFVRLSASLWFVRLSASLWFVRLRTSLWFVRLRTSLWFVRLRSPGELRRMNECLRFILPMSPVRTVDPLRCIAIPA